MGRHPASLLLVLAFGTTTWAYYISDVTISPANPTTQTPVTVTVAGEAPATNYTLDHVNQWQMGNFIFIDMYWTSTDVGATVMVPYTHDESLGTLAAGHYTVYVRSYYSGLVRQTESASFSVSKVPDTSTGLGFFWFYFWSWPGAGGSQTQIIMINGNQISFDFSFSN